MNECALKHTPDGGAQIKFNEKYGNILSATICPVTGKKQKRNADKD
jgi:hypothetical protein